jgi:hypothetical protein
VLFKTQNYVRAGCKSTKLTDEDGDEYYGQINDKGKKHGFGCFVLANGDYYEGEWGNGRRNGIGGLFFQNGSQYTGCWLNGKTNGYGTYKYMTGVYKGNFKEGKFDGEGTLVSADGSV